MKTDKLKKEHLIKGNVIWLLLCFLVPYKPANLHKRKEASKHFKLDELKELRLQLSKEFQIYMLNKALINVYKTWTVQRDLELDSSTIEKKQLSWRILSPRVTAVRDMLL